MMSFPPFFLQGLIPGPPSYFTAFPNVYVAACGTQFFKQCFPSGSIHLGLCCIAVQWLSKIPCSVTGGLYHHQSQNSNERELFRKQAAADWETFLLMRAKELSPGMLEVWRCRSPLISGLDTAFSRLGSSPCRVLIRCDLGPGKTFYSLSNSLHPVEAARPSCLGCWCCHLEIPGFKASILTLAGFVSRYSRVQILGHALPK